MKPLSFAIFFTLLATPAFAETYVVAENLVSADREGPHKTIAQHILGFRNGAVVPAYIADAQDGCTLRFTPGRPASLAKGEKLEESRAFTVRKLVRENCLEWGTNMGGDDVCEKFGEPFTDLLLEGALSRTGGETAEVSCRVYEQTDRNAAFAQWWQSVNGLLNSL